MLGRIAQFLDLVAGSGDDGARGGIDENRTHRHLTAHTGGVGLFESVFHVAGFCHGGNLQGSDEAVK